MAHASVQRPLCAFPLFGNAVAHVAPIERVALMFATDPTNVGNGTVKISGPALLVDLTTVNDVSVSFDFDKGWSWGDAPWGMSIGDTTDLTPYLIES